MKILKNQGKFRVVSKPENVISEIAEFARICYQSQDKSCEENDLKLIKNLMTRGHFAMFEFADIKVIFNGVSRGFTHELVRHRIASYAQESTRYVDEKEFEYIVPPHRDENSYENGIFSFTECLKTNETAYKEFRRRGWKPEDARQILSTALNAQIGMKASVREWRHVFTMRCDLFAHWEIRAVMINLLKWCQANIPVVFDDFKFFKTKDGIEYARPVMSAFNLGEKINEYSEHFDLNTLVNKLDDLTSMKLFQILKEKHFK